jgi:hypothetical protein
MLSPVATVTSVKSATSASFNLVSSTALAAILAVVTLASAGVFIIAAFVYTYIMLLVPVGGAVVNVIVVPDTL